MIDFEMTQGILTLKRNRVHAILKQSITVRVYVKSGEEMSIEYMKIFEREKMIREEVKCVN